MTSQIEKDLIRLAEDRMQNWLKDTRAVFNMADLGDSAAAACIITTLLDTLSRMTRMTNIPPAELVQMLEAVRKAERKRR